MPLFPPQDYRKTEFTHRRGLAAARPAAGDVLVGTLYFSTDTLALERSTGVIWETYAPAGAGAPGPMGPMGPPGIDGIDGEDGIDGINGAAGAQGIPGSTGPAGAQGSPGIPGIDGEDGEDGLSIVGPVGPTGATGAAGANGSQGPIGPPGLDAEEPEYPYIIPGERGPQGPAGGGGGSATTVEVNLGSTAIWRGRFTITDAGIGAGSKVLVWQAPGPYTGKGTRADEAELQPVQVISTAPAAGSAQVYWQTPPIVTDRKLSLMAQSTITPSNPKDPQNITFGNIFRIHKVRGNVKFSYLVFA